MNSARQGFILTRHWRDTPSGIEIDYWLATDSGPQRIRLPLQQAVAFVPAMYNARVTALLSNERGWSLRPLAMQDFSCRPVEGLYCRQYRQIQRIEKILTESEISLYEADIRPPEPCLDAGTPCAAQEKRHAGASDSGVSDEERQKIQAVRRL